MDKYHKELFVCFGVDGVSNCASLDCFVLFSLCFDYLNDKCAESMNYLSLYIYLFKLYVELLFFSIVCIKHFFFGDWRLMMDDCPSLIPLKIVGPA